MHEVKSTKVILLVIPEAGKRILHFTFRELSLVRGKASKSGGAFTMIIIERASCRRNS